MKKFLIILSLFAMVSCSSPIDEVKEGMSQEEVTKILGTANQTSSSSSSSGSESYSEAEWKYNDHGTIKFENDKVIKIIKK